MKKKRDILLVLIIILLLIMVTIQGSVFSTGSAGGTLFTWEDDFFDGSGIDVSLSENYVLDITEGTVSMKDTFEAWYNESRIRMKEITIQNQGSQTFDEYVLDMIIYYDSDMQTDFDDLRFTDTKGNELYYWIGERSTGESANVLVRIPQVLPGITTFYMFYGDPLAMDESTFDMIFTWEDRTNPDIMISYKNYLEGAWDPSVMYGNGRFLVAWEERIGPENLPLGYERMIPCVIHGRSYNSNGEDPYPSGDADINISLSGPTIHAQNPSIAFGNNVFFVVWEENPANDILNRYEADIKGALISVSGVVLDRFTVVTAPSLQCDPRVAYDGLSNRFFVVWEDARGGTGNYDVYGRIFDGSGSPVTNDFQVAGGANCQAEPWICSDDQGNFLVVYEDGHDPSDGPYSLKARRFDSNGVALGSVLSIATGDSSTDHIFPTVSYCPSTQRFLIAWNDADLSSGRWRGNIWGKILDRYGEVVYDTFIIQPGSQYIRADTAPYLDTMFFVSYGGGSDIWGVIVSSDGMVQTNEHKLDDGSSANVDWNNIAVGDGRIFVTWEDERDQASNYPDVFGTVWQVYRSTGSPDITYTVGPENEMITTATVVSKIIDPSEGFVEWALFDATYTTPIGSIRFDVLNEQGTTVLLSDINPGKDISSLPKQPIRLKAVFSRLLPKDTPVLDRWSVTWIGSDHDPPWTTYEMDPSTPNGEYPWYITQVTFTFYAFDNVSSAKDIVTYYKINDGSYKIYDSQNKPRISTDGAGHRIEFYSVDAAGNEEIPHHIIDDIHIDISKPSVTIDSPQWGRITPGTTVVQGTVYESSSGSGIDRIEVWFNGGKAVVLPGQPTYSWSFNAEVLQQYDLEVRAYDTAGNMGNSYVSVRCPYSLVFFLMQFERLWAFIELILELFYYNPYF
ncbi:MAG: DUF2341 domain-containing protein, partial [Candidatus Thermoplasmatota archaeon]|nr:DUF2341 domain-containing protein [Candidatus Thermoplasmatota archaeon]